MTKINDFRKALQFVLQWEGGYVIDPDDPGGETKWGISKRAHPDLDIALLTPEIAAEIYAKEYWDALGCDGIDFPYNVAVFDTAVNIGVRRTGKWCQDCTSPEQLLEKRKQWYYSLVNKNPTNSKYLRGWLNRLNDLQKFIEINTPQT
jgi:lysozyme family protein